MQGFGTFQLRVLFLWLTDLVLVNCDNVKMWRVIFSTCSAATTHNSCGGCFMMNEPFDRQLSVFVIVHGW